jgi:YaaC-like Protein
VPAEVGVRYAQPTHVLPSVGGSGKPSHPLVTWWAVLFSLSMIARYVPDGWGEIISVNVSPAATAVESLLSQAATGLPELIYDTIVESATIGTR